MEIRKHLRHDYGAFERANDAIADPGPLHECEGCGTTFVSALAWAEMCRGGFFPFNGRYGRCMVCKLPVDDHYQAEPCRPAVFA